jgi:two-component system, OmpR family, alkaline phosphatase synthesis response regulator PhoP
MKENTKKHILLIEDEIHIAEGLKLNLVYQGYEVTIATDGVSGLQKWKEIQPDLIVLDIMLPGIDGFSVLQNIRLLDERLPVLILSAKGAADDKVRGLAYGGDDYLAKPFNLEEFLLRVERLLTRSSWQENGLEGQKAGLSSLPETFDFGGNQINFETSTAICKTGNIKLTEQEVILLKLFIVNQGKPLSRKKILEIGWGYTGGMTTRTVDNFIVRFRKYFEKNPKKPSYFKSLRSVGYIFEIDAEAQSR